MQLTSNEMRCLHITNDRSPNVPRTGMRIGSSAGWVLLAIVAVSASAQISLSSAVSLAEQSDPRIKMAQASVKKAAAALAETYDAYVPSVDMNAGYGKGVGVPTSLPTVFSLSGQSLAYNFSQRDNIRAASAGLEAAKLQLRDTREQVDEDVAVTYVNLDNAQRRQEATAQELGFANRLVTIIQERLDAGQDTQINLLKGRRVAKEIELQQLQTADDIAALSDHLARLIGLPGNQLATVSSSIPPLPPVSALAPTESKSLGVQSAFANARSKQELAFGASRYRLRPSFALGMNYTRIDTGESDYTTYYPGFKGRSDNAESIYLGIQIPLFDRKHEDEAHQAQAEAARAHFEAQSEQDKFFEGRLKLQHSTAELEAQSELAEIDRDLSQAQLNAILVQLSPASGSSDQQQMTPKDEQNARVQERARTIDLLNAQFQLSQAEINLLRQNGQLDNWLKTSTTHPNAVGLSPVTH
jgi:outer membrane protein TolC